MLFSERNHITKPEIKFQKDYMDKPLRNRLWNLIDEYYWSHSDNQFFDTYNYLGDHLVNSITPLVIEIQGKYFNQPIDELPVSWSSWRQKVKSQFFTADWNKIYDFIEFLISTNYINIHRYTRRNLNQNSCFYDDINKALECEFSAYRLIDDKFVPITNDIEIASVEEATSDDNPYDTVREHFSTAIKLLSDKEKPDYRNSIKESISAVEAVCKILTKEERGTLGAVLNNLEKNGVVIPKVFRESISKLYGYTNDNDGIRHCLMEEPNVDFPVAKYMLVACCAFCNFLIDKSK